MPNASDLPTDKVGVRAQLRGRRRERLARETDLARTATASALAEHLQPVIDRLPAGGRVASFESLPSEPSTRSLHQSLARAGLEVIVPVLLPDNDLDWRLLDVSTSLGVDAICAADLIILPALAIGRDGMRLGQGGGSYDRALLRVKTGVPLIAVVHDDEVLETVPSESHDRPVDAVVTVRSGIERLRRASRLPLLGD